MSVHGGSFDVCSPSRSNARDATAREISLKKIGGATLLAPPRNAINWSFFTIAYLHINVQEYCISQRTSIERSGTVDDTSFQVGALEMYRTRNLLFFFFTFPSQRNQNDYYRS